MYLKCDRLDDFGRGICFSNGKIVFVPIMLPSEEGEVEIVSEKKKYMVGRLLNLKKISPNRTKSKCECSSCGCQLKHMEYKATLDFKVDKVRESLKKFGGIEVSNLKVITTNKYGYRNKVTLKIKNGKLGYFKNGTHDINEIDSCIIASPNINKIISILKQEDLSSTSEITIRDMESIMISVTGSLDISRLKTSVNSIYMNGKHIYVDKRIKNKIGDFEYYVTYDSFFQVNNNITKKLYEKVRELAGNGHHLLDLFCGCGTIGIFLSKNFDKVTGIDINKESIKCAKDNAKINKIDNIDFLCGDANVLSKNVNSDVIVVDPARSGLSIEGISNILDIMPKKIVYVSCNPITLARDLKLLDTYEVKEVTLFDMFPFTYHCESITVLERK